MRQLMLLVSGLTTIAAFSQQASSKLVGRYSDGITSLALNEDHTFDLNTPDYVFPYTYQNYQNSGTWSDSANVVTLNPHKEKRQARIQLEEKVLAISDSIQIKLNYVTEVYEEEKLVIRGPADFNLLTLYVNKQKNYRNLVHAPVYRVCAFSPRVKKQAVVDSFNTVNFPKQKVERIGVYTYGFQKYIELETKNPNANYFEIIITQPVDKERMPRSKKVIIKGKHAYFYERNGKIPTSGILLSGLKREEE